MKVHVQVFSFLREYLPEDTSARGELDVELPEQATLKDLFLQLGIDRHMGVEIFDMQVENTFQVMINQVSVNDYAHRLIEGDRVVMFPPMAGG